MEYHKISQSKVEQLISLFKTIKIHSALGWDVSLGHTDTDPDEALSCMEEIFSILELEPPEPTEEEIAEAEEEGQ